MASRRAPQREVVVFHADTPKLELPPGIEREIAAALAGDAHSWGRLYGIASAAMRGGFPVPEPLRAVVAERLAAIAIALGPRVKGRPRDLLPDAVAPDPGRSGGRRPDPDIVRAADAVAELCERDKSRGRVTWALKITASLSAVPRKSIEDALPAARERLAERRAAESRETGPISA